MIRSLHLGSPFALFAACFIARAALASSVQAHEGVTLGPIPEWVVAVSAGESNSNDLGGAGDGVEHLLVDDQVRLGVAPAERFARRIFRVRDERGARDSAEFKVEFDPSFETIVLHHVTIHRGGREIDRLSEAGIHLLQRESELEAHLYDQRMTAVLFLEDVRVGDEVETAYSVRGENPVFGGLVSERVPFGWRVPVRRRSYRLLVPSARTLRTRAYHAPDPSLHEADGSREYRWDVRDVSAVRPEQGIPAWFEPYPYFDLCEFPDWASVAQWGSRWFAHPDPPSSALTTEIQAIAAANTSAPGKIEAALAFVRDEIRYLGLELGPGSYRPSPPNLVLERRFGDCKDKAMLLGTILDGLGLHAEVAFVHTESGRGLIDRLPSPVAFNHAIVHVELDGRSHWLDPTRLHARGSLDHLTCPDYGFALVLGPSTSALTRIDPAAEDRPRLEVHTRIDASRLEGDAQMTVESAYFRGDADRARAKFAEEGRSEIEKGYLNTYARFYPSIRTTNPIELRDDPAANTFVTTEHYAIPEFWKPRVDSQKVEAEFDSCEILEFAAAPAAPIRTMPLGTPYPDHVVSHTSAKLPGTWNLEPHHREIANDALRFTYDSKFSGSELELDYDCESLQGEVPPERARVYAEALAQIRATTKFTIARNRPGKRTEGGASGLESTNRAVLGFAFLALLVSAAGAVFLYRYRPSRPPVVQVPAYPDLIGIRGWLLIAGIGVLYTPLYLSTHVAGLISKIGGPGWETLTSPNSSQYRALWAPLLLSEVFANIAMLCVSAVLAVLFLQKRRTFPLSFVIVRSAWCAFLILDALAARQVPGVHDESKIWTYVGTVLSTIVWGLYFWKSRRVRATFVSG